MRGVVSQGNFRKWSVSVDTKTCPTSASLGCMTHYHVLICTTSYVYLFLYAQLWYVYICLLTLLLSSCSFNMSAKTQKRKKGKREINTISQKPHYVKDGHVHKSGEFCDTAVQSASSVVMPSPSPRNAGVDKKPCATSTILTANSASTKNTVDTPISSLEDDIAWCVTQLEMAISGKTVTKQQKEETLKYIKLLQSSKTPVPRKRQIMRQKFGDYKQKMKERPLPSTSSKLKIPDHKHISSAGNFHRKSTKLSTCSVGDSSFDDKLSPVLGDHISSLHSQSLSSLCKELESTSFTFNFSID